MNARRSATSAWARGRTSHSGPVKLAAETPEVVVAPIDRDGREPRADSDFDALARQGIFYHNRGHGAGQADSVGQPPNQAA